MAKKDICISIQINVKIKFSQVCASSKWAGNMLMFHVDLNMKWLGIRFKNDFNDSDDSELTLSFERQ